VAEPGLNWKWPFIDRVAGRVSLRVNQITLTMQTKTKDNVFVTIPISVQSGLANFRRDHQDARALIPSMK
jgi:regulator of protease activity HflC (stomatin/prohibitin superfamily)